MKNKSNKPAKGTTRKALSWPADYSCWPKAVPDCPPCLGPEIKEGQIADLWFDPVQRADMIDKVNKKGTFTVNMPGLTHEDAERIKAIQRPVEYVWRDGAVHGPFAKEKFEYTFPPGSFDRSMNDAGDMLLGAVDQIKERRKKIDQIDRTIRLIRTADQAARVVSLVAQRISGKESPLKDDYDRLHLSIIETLLSQKAYLQMQNEQSIDGGRTLNPANQEELVVSFDEEMIQFIHACMFEIKDLKEKIEKLKSEHYAREVNNERANTIINRQNHELRIKAEVLQKQITTGQEEMDQLTKEVSHLKKQNAGLKSRITKAGV